jgi:hypothetical protein
MEHYLAELPLVVGYAISNYFDIVIAVCLIIGLFLVRPMARNDLTKKSRQDTTAVHGGP